MDIASFRAKATVGAGICLLVIAVDFILASPSFDEIDDGMDMLAIDDSLSVPWLAWPSELRRLGKKQWVREIQFIEVVLVAPVLLGVVTSSAHFLLLFAAAGMLAAFGLGMWQRRIAGRI